MKEKGFSIDETGIQDPEREDEWLSVLPEDRTSITVNYEPYKDPSKFNPICWRVIVRGQEEKYFAEMELSDELLTKQGLDYAIKEMERGLHSAILDCVKNEMIKNYDKNDKNNKLPKL